MAPISTLPCSMYPIYCTHTVYMYALNLFYINDLYLKCPLYRVLPTMHVCDMYPVYRMYPWGMYGTVISNAWYISWYTWYMYPICMGYTYCIVSMCARYTYHVSYSYVIYIYELFLFIILNAMSIVSDV